jgi:hypothetical protein
MAKNQWQRASRDGRLFCALCGSKLTKLGFGPPVDVLLDNIYGRERPAHWQDQHVLCTNTSVACDVEYFYLRGLGCHINF